MNIRETISLGKKCQTAWFLRTRKLRRKTYIFDNMISRDVNAVTNLMVDNFRYFFEEKNIEVIHKNSWDCLTVLDRKSGLFSVHDFPQKVPMEDSLQLMREAKLSVAQEMMRLMVNCNDKLLFVRVNNESEPLDNTMRLYDTLTQFRNGKPFHLFVFQKNPIMQERWGLTNLSTFFDGPWEWDRGRNGWKGNVDLWDAAFAHVRLAPPKIL